MHAALDRIDSYFGDLSTVQFGRTEKIRPVIRKWRSEYQDKPRAADMGMQVLSRVLSHAVELGLIASNPCEGIKSLYKGSRAHVIWADEDIAGLKAVCSPEIGWAVDLAAPTGLRVSDLIRLTWSDIGEKAIVLSTSKSNHQREAVIPLYEGLLEVLKQLPKRSPVVLTSRRGKPWTRDGLAASFNKAKKAAGLNERDLHFHDLRGTAATRFYQAGLSMRLIAEIMAWEEATVERIIYRYVSRDAAMQEAIRQLNETGSGTNIVKPDVKPASGSRKAHVKSLKSLGAGDGDRTHDIKLGKLPFDRLINARIELDQINEGFDALESGSALRQIVMPHGVK